MVAFIYTNDGKTNHFNSVDFMRKKRLQLKVNIKLPLGDSFRSASASFLHGDCSVLTGLSFIKK